MGAATARLMVAEGAQVILGDILPEVEQTAASLGHKAIAVLLDVTDEQSWRDAVAQGEAHFGKIDVLVNNAGILLMDELGKTTSEIYRKVNDVNAFGCFLGMRETQPALKRAGGGSIVNLSSVAARLGAPGQYVDYAASKGAIDSFTTGLAREVAAEGIRVNAVRPGIIDTDIHASGGQPNRAHESAVLIPMQRPGSSDEVAAAIVWLLSDAAAYTTGAILDVSGGR